MYTTELALNKSESILNNSYTNCMSTVNKILNLTPHKLAMDTWLICEDPQLAMKYINLLLWMAIMDHVWNLSKGIIYKVILK